MSVIVKGMEMPKNCRTCPMLFDGHSYRWCNITGESLGIEETDNGRDEYCPLIELPPHGRLGDLDALYAEISNGNKAYNGIDGYDGEYLSIANVDDCLDAIKYAETVIEAEGETEGR